jgi:hypothetical protein
MIRLVEYPPRRYSLAFVFVLSALPSYKLLFSQVVFRIVFINTYMFHFCLFECCKQVMNPTCVSGEGTF